MAPRVAARPDGGLRPRNTFGNAREPHSVLTEIELGTLNSLLHSELHITTTLPSISTFLAPLPGRESQGKWDEGLG